MRTSAKTVSPPCPAGCAGVADPQHWFPLWYHSCVRLQCLLMETWPQTNNPWLLFHRREDDSTNRAGHIHEVFQIQRN